MTSLPLPPPVGPMEATPVTDVPSGPGWQYEPKWDGFRCLAFRDGEEVYLQSKSGQPLGRYFPDIVAMLAALPARRFVLDGELTVPVAGQPEFEELQLRLHPAASRVARLAEAHPALLLVFDLLVDDEGTLIADRPLAERRPRLEEFAARVFPAGGLVRLSPASSDRDTALSWFSVSGGGLDGIIAKRLDGPYAFGQRSAMVKYKAIRSADCVVGGFRWNAAQTAVASLLLGLYGPDGLLHHVGFTSGIKSADKTELTHRLVALGKGPGFTGRAPGGPSRWNGGKETPYAPLPHALVVEVTYDHVTGGRFRHGTGLHRWRPDKRPDQCGQGQIDRATASALRLVGTTYTPAQV